MTEVERSIRDPDEPNFVPDIPLAARAAFAMYESHGLQTLKWTFVSPPARFRPGPRTGKYEIWEDVVPLAPAKERKESENEFDGRLLGVSVADLAVAVADEVERGELVGKHWSPASEWEGDEVYPGYLKL